MNRVTYLKYGKRRNKVIDKFHGAVTIGKGKGGDGVGLRLKFFDGEDREIVLLFDDTATLENLGAEIAATLSERRGIPPATVDQLSEEQKTCHDCGDPLETDDCGYGTTHGICSRCKAKQDSPDDE